MQIRLYSTPARGAAFLLFYITLMFATLEQTPKVVDWLSSRGQLANTVNLFSGGMFVLILSLSFRGRQFLHRSYWFTLIASGAIFYLVSVNTVTMAERLHLFTYGIFTLLLYSLLRFKIGGMVLFISSGIITAMLGLLEEIIQYVLPDRFFGWGDVAINALGGLLALMFIRFVFGDRGEICAI